jgi:homogentisate 1,2-dioxygenase
VCPFTPRKLPFRRIVVHARRTFLNYHEGALCGHQCGFVNGEHHLHDAFDEHMRPLAEGMEYACEACMLLLLVDVHT